MQTARVLLTNDDGIDAAGLRALADRLREDHDVTVVAPAEDRSGVGRSRSSRVTVTEHAAGHVVDGTPVDCVVAGLRGLDGGFDVVVAGANHGPNAGAHVLGRSGTVGAAVEAALLGTPALAVSAYDPERVVPTAPDRDAFAEAARAVAYILSETNAGAALSPGEYLNVNAPIGTGTAPMRRTRPTHDFEVAVDRDGSEMTFEDRWWVSREGEGETTYPPGTERRGIVDGAVTVSPLRAPHAVTDRGLDDVVDAY